jgi:hypothetical protein
MMFFFYLLFALAKDYSTTAFKSSFGSSSFRLCTNLLASERAIEIPASVEAMMKDAADSCLAAVEFNEEAKSPFFIVDIPLPVTGGTELDDWPGGINQKFATMKPMVEIMMKRLNFTNQAIQSRDWLGKYGEEDKVGVWRHGGISVCTFVTPETVDELLRIQKWGDSTSSVIIVNPQLFLDPLRYFDLAPSVDSLSL